MSELIEQHHHHHHDGNNDDNKKGKGVSEKSDYDLDYDDEDENNSKKMKKSSTDLDLDDEDVNKSRSTDDGSNSKSSWEVIGRDLALEIFLCLPPVSVIRAGSACKYWYELISDTSFLRSYARRFHSQRLHLDKPPGILLCPGNCPKHSVYAILPQDQDQDQEHQPSLKVFLDLSLPAFKLRFPHAFIVDSCNGLLLYCERTTNPDYNSVNALKYTIHNPLLNQFEDIPRLDHHHLLQTFKSTSPDQIILIERKPYIVFDPSSISPSYSYKVLVMLHAHPFKEFQVHVYFSETKQWRRIKTIDHDARNAAHLKTTMFDGAWYCLRDDDVFYFDDANYTVSFIQLPPKPKEHVHDDVLYFGECGGRLQLIQGYDPEEHWFPFTFTIMEMEKPVLGQQRTWIQKFRVEINSGNDHLIDQGAFESAIEAMHPYETEEGHEVVLLSINNQMPVFYGIITRSSIDNHKLVSYNITTQTFGKELTIPYFESDRNLDIFPFTPTLFPLYKLTTLEEWEHACMISLG